MKRSTGLKRAGFARAIIPRIRVPAVPIPPETAARIRYTGAANSGPVPKADPLQHAGYIHIVRSLQCYRCGVVGFTQFCHSDEGKGERIKSDCRLGWPGCGPRFEYGLPLTGCHYDIGTARVLPKAQRREFEARAAAHTRATVRAMGLWPADLPAWPADEARAA